MGKLIDIVNKNLYVVELSQNSGGSIQTKKVKPEEKVDLVGMLHVDLLIESPPVQDTSTDENSALTYLFRKALEMGPDIIGTEDFYVWLVRDKKKGFRKNPDGTRVYFGTANYWLPND